MSETEHVLKELDNAVNAVVSRNFDTYFDEKRIKSVLSKWAITRSIVKRSKAHDTDALKLSEASFKRIERLAGTDPLIIGECREAIAAIRNTRSEKE